METGTFLKLMKLIFASSVVGLVLILALFEEAWADGIKYDSVSVGAEYGSGERDMKIDGGSQSFTFGGSTTSDVYPSAGDSVKGVKAKEQSLLVKGSVKLEKGEKYADIYAKAGIAKLSYSYTFSTPGSADEKDEFVGDNGFAWGVGFSGKVAEIKKVGLLIDAEYSAYDLKGEYKIDGESISDAVIKSAKNAGYTTVTGSYSTSTKVSEWHAGLTATTTMGIFTPFAGIRYSDMNISNTLSISGTANGIAYSGTGTEKFKADKNVGVVVGTGVSLSKSLSVNVKANLIDETSGRVGVNYSF